MIVKSDLVSDMFQKSHTGAKHDPKQVGGVLENGIGPQHDERCSVFVSLQWPWFHEFITAINGARMRFVCGRFDDEVVIGEPYAYREEEEGIYYIIDIEKMEKSVKQTLI